MVRILWWLVSGKRWIRSQLGMYSGLSDFGKQEAWRAHYARLLAASLPVSRHAIRLLAVVSAVFCFVCLLFATSLLCALLVMGNTYSRESTYRPRSFRQPPCPTISWGSPCWPLRATQARDQGASDCQKQLGSVLHEIGALDCVTQNQRVRAVCLCVSQKQPLFNPSLVCCHYLAPCVLSLRQVTDSFAGNLLLHIAVQCHQSNHAIWLISLQLQATDRALQSINRLSTTADDNCLPLFTARISPSTAQGEVSLLLLLLPVKIIVSSFVVFVVYPHTIHVPPSLDTHTPFLVPMLLSVPCSWYLKRHRQPSTTEALSVAPRFLPPSRHFFLHHF